MSEGVDIPSHMLTLGKETLFALPVVFVRQPSMMRFCKRLPSVLLNRQFLFLRLPPTYLMETQAVLSVSVVIFMSCSFEHIPRLLRLACQLRSLRCSLYSESIWWNYISKSLYLRKYPTASRCSIWLELSQRRLAV